MKINPLLVVKAFQVCVVLFLVSMLTLCVYSGYGNYQQERGKPVHLAENIQRWELRKFEYLEYLVCDGIQLEIEKFSRNGEFCNPSIESTIGLLKKYVIEKNDPWFDTVGIPDGHRSMEGVNLTLKNIRCEAGVLEKWRACSLGQDPPN